MDHINLNWHNNNYNQNHNSMKKIVKMLFTAIILLVSYGKVAAQSEVIGKPVSMGNLEVAQHDFAERMTWEDAKKACEALGKEWHLPTKLELNTLYKNRETVGGFANDIYWSSSENFMHFAWIQHFRDGMQYNPTDDTSKFYVRAVRAL
jgi:hypothetical protein